MVLHERAFARFSTEVCKFKAMDQRLAICTLSVGSQHSDSDKLLSGQAHLKNCMEALSNKGRCLQQSRATKYF